MKTSIATIAAASALASALFVGTAPVHAVEAAPVGAETVDQDAFCANVRVIHVGVCGGDEPIVPRLDDVFDTVRGFRFRP